ncbi:branched-chain amino acid ABC transporter permease [Variovorax terrae]|uniref:Branched-chain amino acid ABC transporter permease n=1 Tax=Variovorax terrae TaxID=2923278 RepID=A0A9X2ARY8_9BURK|nr:branched-chain amino acid ABC transporter permease [Variovorax terrae]
MDTLLPFFVSGLGLGAVYALSGVGLVVLFRSAGVLNFAFGAIGALGAYVAWSALERDWPLALACAACVASSMALSLGYGRLLAPLLAQREPTIRSIATLGFALIVTGFTEWYWDEQPRRLSLPTDADGVEFATALGDVRLTYTRLIGLALAGLMVLAIGLLLSRTRIGLKMRALANDRDLSALLGIRVLQVDTVAWVLSGAFAGVCGLLLANMVRLQATLLTFLVIPAFAAAILGRLHSLPATVAAGLGIGVLEALAITVPGFAAYRTATPFLVALVAILFFRNTARKA